MDKIKELIEKGFEECGKSFRPRDPGRQEYRKCGRKEECLELEIEEVLYDLLVKGVSADQLSVYARKRGYGYFREYAEIRSHGYILLPHLLPTERRSYFLYRPDKDFNRTRAVPQGLIVFVSPEEAFFSVAAGLQEVWEGKVFFLIGEDGTSVIVEMERDGMGRLRLQDIRYDK
jgi:hypothetical protein